MINSAEVEKLKCRVVLPVKRHPSHGSEHPHKLVSWSAVGLAANTQQEVVAQYLAPSVGTFGLAWTLLGDCATVHCVVYSAGSTDAQFIAEDLGGTGNKMRSEFEMPLKEFLDCLRSEA